MKNIFEFSINPMEGVVELICKKTVNFMKDIYLNKKYIDKIETHFIRYQNELYYNEITKFLDVEKIEWFCNKIENLIDENINCVELVEGISKDFYNLCRNSQIELLESECYLFFSRLFHIIISYKFESLTVVDRNQITIMKSYIDKTAVEIKEVRNEMLRQKNIQEKILTDVQLNMNVVEQFKNSFIDEYHEPLFYEDKKSPSALKLSDVYIPPRYTLGGIEKDDTLQMLNDFADNMIEAEVLVISGEPAVGKSSLIRRFISDRTYLAKDHNIIVIPMKELGNEEDFADMLCKKFSVGIHHKNTFLSNKILVLDGYDEFCFVNAIENPDEKYRKIVRNICARYSGIKNSRIIITTRANYINIANVVNSVFITLEPFDKDQIYEYINKYNNLRCGSMYNLKDSIIDSVKEVIAIPMILYMVVHFGIKLNKASSKAEIYSKIFNEDGVLFNNKHNEDYQIVYKNKFIEIPQKIAFEMFKKRDLKYFLSDDLTKDKIFENLQENELKAVSSYFGAMCYYKDNIIQTKCIEFIHKSLYEYFLAKYFFNILNKENANDEAHLESICDTFAWNNFSYLEMKKNSSFEDVVHNNEILDYYKYHVYNYMDTSNRRMEMRIRQMKYVIEHDFFHPNSYWKYRNTISKSKCGNLFDRSQHFINAYLNNVFSMYWNLNYFFFNTSESASGYQKELNEIINSRNFIAFMKQYGCEHFMLSNVKLDHLNLNRQNFFLADLRGAHLMGSSLNESDLRGAIFAEADLRCVDFIYADLINADFSNANLENACFTNACLTRAKFKGAKLYNTVFDNRNIKIIEEQFEDKEYLRENIFVHNRINGVVIPYAKYADNLV